MGTSMSSRDLQAVVKTQKAFIKELLDRLSEKDNKEWTTTHEILRDRACQPMLSIQGHLYTVKRIIDYLNDDYFKGLTLEQILELAKKSIRLTDDNCKMRHKLEDIEEIVNAIYDYQVECKDKTNKEFLDKQLQKIFDKILDK